MKYPIYAIRDNLVGFQSPTIMNNDAFAMRQFKDVFSDVNNPEDYALYKIGDFDTDSGDLIPLKPIIICHATDFVKGVKDNG